MAANAILHPASALRAVTEAIRLTTAGGRRTAAATVLKNLAGSAGVTVTLSNAATVGATLTFAGLLTVASNRVEITSQPSSLSAILAMAAAGGLMRIKAVNGSWWVDVVLGLASTPATLTANLTATVGISNRGIYIGFDAALDTGAVTDTETLNMQLIVDEMTTANQVQPANWAATINGVAPNSIWGVPFDTKGPYTGRAIGPAAPGQGVRTWGVIGHLPNGPTGDVSGIYQCVRRLFAIGYAPSMGGWWQGMMENGGSNIVYSQLQDSWSFLTSFEVNPRGAAYGTRFRLTELGYYGGKAHSYHFYGNNTLTLPSAKDAKLILCGYQYRYEADTAAILAAQLPNVNTFHYAGGDEFTGGTNYYEIGHSRFRAPSPTILPSDPAATQWRFSICTNPDVADSASPLPSSTLAFLIANPPPFSLMV